MMSSSTMKESINNEAFASMLETPVDLKPYTTRWVDRIELMFLHLAAFRADPYNAVKSTVRFELSKLGRLQLTRGVDLIDTFEVDLVCGEKVESATLFISLDIPVDPVIRETYLTSENVLNIDTTVGECTNIWMPIKTIKNPERIFKFFDKPINPSVTFQKFSIEIKMDTSSERIDVKHRNIFMDVYMLDVATRRIHQNVYSECRKKCSPVVLDFVRSQIANSVTNIVRDIWEKPQQFSNDLFCLFKYHMKNVQHVQDEFKFLFLVTIPRKAELSEMKQFDINMHQLGFRKTQGYTYTISVTNKPYEYEVWGKPDEVLIHFSLDSNPFISIAKQN